MTRRLLKHPPINNMQEAIRSVFDYGEAKHNYSKARVAERICTTEWVAYKWISKGSIPSDKIIPLEHVCGVNFITQYLANSAHKLLIDIPKGTRTEAKEINELAILTNKTLGLIMRLAEGKAEVNETIEAITLTIESFAWQRINISKQEQPELDLD